MDNKLTYGEYIENLKKEMKNYFSKEIEEDNKPRKIIDLLTAEEKAALKSIDNLLEENPSPETLIKIKKLTNALIENNNESY
jgi:DNA replication protein DnaD